MENNLLYSTILKIQGNLNKWDDCICLRCKKEKIYIVKLKLLRDTIKYNNVPFNLFDSYIPTTNYTVEIKSFFNCKPYFIVSNAYNYFKKSEYNLRNHLNSIHGDYSEGLLIRFTEKEINGINDAFVKSMNI